MEDVTPEQSVLGRRIRFDVSGVMFAIDESRLKSGPWSKLTQLCQARDASNTGDIIIIDRPADSFGAIMAWYQTGELHIPKTSCPGAFLKEMEFWEINLNSLTTCCFLKLQRHLEEQTTVADFRRQILMEPDAGPKLLPCSSLESLRGRIWSVVDNLGYTFPSKVYLLVTLVVIVVSIVTASLSTCDTYRRSMTNCERMEFMRATKMEHAKLFADWIGTEDCENITLPYVDGWRLNTHGFERGYEYVEIPEIQPNTTQSLPNGSVSVKVPTMKIPIRSIIILEYLTIAFFTIDFVIRLFTCPSIGSYFKSFINIIDAIALFFSYLHLIVSQFDQESINELTLGEMVMIRSVRLFRVVRNLTAARVLLYTLNRNLKELFIVFLFLVAGVCIFSSAAYLSEYHEEFRAIENIPSGWYWAVITMTTVGYGDIIPVTRSGRIIACLCAMSGVVMLALTVPIFAKHFLTLYQYASMKCLKFEPYNNQRFAKPHSQYLQTPGVILSTPGTREAPHSAMIGRQTESMQTMTNGQTP